MSIIVKDLTKFYGKQKALNNISFEIKSGEIVGFLGPNGAGKSTMMKILTGYIPLSLGEAYVNDVKIEAETIDVRSQIGYLPEHNPLYLDMYVREYLFFVAGMYQLKNKKERVEEMIELTGLTRESSKKISALSKGYRQRVGLAQALIHNPSVLILDEPTSGLDPNQIVEIRDLIKKVGKEKTVMLSTHIMQEVEAICDKFIIIDKGEIVAEEEIQNSANIVKEDNVIIQLEFDTEIDSDLLKSNPQIIELISTKDNTWHVVAKEDIRSELFEFAVKNNLKVLSMNLVKKTLEEIFQEITKK